MLFRRLLLNCLVIRFALCVCGLVGGGVFVLCCAFLIGVLLLTLLFVGCWLQYCFADCGGLVVGLWFWLLLVFLF